MGRKPDTQEQKFIKSVYRAEDQQPVMVAEGSHYHELAYRLHEQGQVQLKASSIPGVLEVRKPKGA